jgi:hypothetical protein
VDRKRIEDGQFSYESIGRFFDELRKSPDDARLAVGCALAVYGWMPRMLGKVDCEAWRRTAASLDVWEGLQPFVNRSWTGTSKFLHFWQPERFSIWDSRVRRSIQRVEKFNVYDASSYRRYCEAVTEVAQDPQIFVEHWYQPVAEVVRATNARTIEAALYIVGVKP